MPLKRVRRGDQLEGIPEELNNGVIDLLASRLTDLMPVKPTVTPTSVLPGALAVPVRNTSGSDWTAAYPIVRVTAPSILPSDNAAVLQQSLRVEGDDPDGSEVLWGVMQGPCKDGASRVTVFRGLTWASVDIVNEAHTTCGTNIGDPDKLISGSGTAEIIYKPSGTGAKDCLVNLSAGGGSDTVKTYNVRLNGRKNRDDSTASVYLLDASLTNVGSPIDVDDAFYATAGGGLASGPNTAALGRVKLVRSASGGSKLELESILGPAAWCVATLTEDMGETSAGIATADVTLFGGSDWQFGSPEDGIGEVYMQATLPFHQFLKSGDVVRGTIFGTETETLVYTIDEAPGEVRPVSVYSSGLDDGDTAEPDHDNYFSGMHTAIGDIWILVNDIQRIGRLWLPAGGVLNGKFSGTHDPDPEGSSDSRPVYRVDAPVSGDAVAIVTTEASAANWTTPATPVPSSDGRVTTYKINSSGNPVVDETGVALLNFSKSTQTVDSVIEAKEFQGRRIFGLGQSGSGGAVVVGFCGLITDNFGNSAATASFDSLDGDLQDDLDPDGYLEDDDNPTVQKLARQEIWKHQLIMSEEDPDYIYAVPMYIDEGEDEGERLIEHWYNPSELIDVDKFVMSRSVGPITVIDFVRCYEP